MAEQMLGPDPPDAQARALICPVVTSPDSISRVTLTPHYGFVPVSWVCSYAILNYSGSVQEKSLTGQKLGERGSKGREEKQPCRRIESYLVWLEWSESEVTKGEAWKFP